MRGVFKKCQDIIYALILSLAISFMLFLYEPITMYANNTNDFWFDYYTLIGPTSLFFLLTFVGIFIGLLIVYLFAKSKEKFCRNGAGVVLGAENQPHPVFGWGDAQSYCPPSRR